MDADARSYGIAGVALLCALAGAAAIGTVFAEAPSEPEGDGMGMFFAGLVLLAVLSVTLFALLEAGLLAGLVTWANLRRRPRFLLEAGALVGGLAVLLPWAAVEFGREAIPLAGAGTWSVLAVVLAGLGLLSTGLGTLAVAVGPLSGSEGRLLGGALLVVLAGAVAGGLPTGEELPGTVAAAGPLYAALGLYALALAGLLATAAALWSDAARWLALPLALLGTTVAVLEFLTDSFWAATLAALAAVVTLWAFWALYPRGRPPEAGRDAGAAP